jgi:hypothetical protein
MDTRKRYGVQRRRVAALVLDIILERYKVSERVFYLGGNWLFVTTCGVIVLDGIIRGAASSSSSGLYERLCFKLITTRSGGTG